MIDQLVNRVKKEVDDNLRYAKKYLLAIDTTFVQKVKGAMSGVQKWSHGQESVIGHHWAIAGLLGCFDHKWKCFPVVSNLLSGNQERFRWRVNRCGDADAMDFWPSILAMIDTIGQSIDTKGLIIVADAYFSKANFINPLVNKGAALVSRLRRDAVGFDDPIYSGRGRPPLRGKQWKLAEMIDHLPLGEVKAVVYGQSQIFQCAVRDLWLRNVENKVRVVAIRAKGRPILLISTDLSLTAQEIIEIYGARFSIEIAIRDLKQHVGFSDYQMTTTLGIVRFVQLCCCALSIGQLILSKSQSLSWMDSESDSLSPLTLRASLKRFVIKRLICNKSVPGADLRKDKELIDAVSQIAA